MATWLPALLQAILGWLTSIVIAQSKKTGEDAPKNLEVSGKLNSELDAWKKANGVPR